MGVLVGHSSQGRAISVSISSANRLEASKPKQGAKRGIAGESEKNQGWPAQESCVRYWDCLVYIARNVWAALLNVWAVIHGRKMTYYIGRRTDDEPILSERREGCGLSQVYMGTKGRP